MFEYFIPIFICSTSPEVEEFRSIILAQQGLIQVMRKIEVTQLPIHNSLFVDFKIQI
jgi:hypothetical protein